MKIIVAGNDQQLTKDLKCKKCECEFQIEKDEAIVSADHRDVDVYSIECPYCHNKMWFKWRAY